jgi:hypothetical protein
MGTGAQPRLSVARIYETRWAIFLSFPWIRNNHYYPENLIRLTGELIVRKHIFFKNIKKQYSHVSPDILCLHISFRKMKKIVSHVKTQISIPT